MMRYALIAVGLLLGIWHFKVAIKAMFVFRDNDPSSMWNFILTGPLSTLPAVIVSFLWPKIGGSWLLLGAVLSAVFAVIATLDQRLIWVILLYCAPMLILGLGLLLLGNQRAEE